VVVLRKESGSRQNAGRWPTGRSYKAQLDRRPALFSTADVADLVRKEIGSLQQPSTNESITEYEYERLVGHGKELRAH